VYEVMAGSKATEACLLTGALFLGVFGLTSSAPSCIYHCVLTNQFCFIAMRSNKVPLETSRNDFCEMFPCINVFF